jgi:hypothetical protein
LILAVYLLCQTGSVCESYHILIESLKQVKSQRSTGQKVNVDDISMLTVQEMMWHSLADGDWAGLLTGKTSGRKLDQSMVDKWHLSVEWESATWPSHGQPRGTQSSAKVVGFKSFGVHGF